MNQLWYTPLLEIIDKSRQDYILLEDINQFLTISEIFNELKQKGFTIYPLQQEFALRKFLREFSGEKLIITTSDKSYIPSDIKESFFYIKWDLSIMLPVLDRGIIQELPISWIPALLSHYKKVVFSQSKKLDRDETIPFIFASLFQVQITPIMSIESFLYLQIRLFDQWDVLPEWCCQWLCNNLPKQCLGEVAQSKLPFYEWLEGQWGKYIDEKVQNTKPEIDFEEPALRVAMISLFQSGKIKKHLSLTSTETMETYKKEHPWSLCGLDMDPTNRANLVIKPLQKQLIDCLEEVGTNDWGLISQMVGQIQYEADSAELPCAINESTYQVLDTFFTDWILASYRDFWFMTSQQKPYVNHQIMDYLACTKAPKIALICFDGMAFQEWFVIQSYLEAHYINHFNISSVFALLPTLTSLSRKALFTGIGTYSDNKSEPAGFNEIIDRKFLHIREKKLFKNVPLQWTTGYSDYDFLGLIINLVDDLAHSDQYIGRGKKTMQMNLKKNLCDSGFHTMIENLLVQGYRIFITSDHGTIYSEGNGYKMDKYLVDSSAKRALIYSNYLLADHFAEGKPVVRYTNDIILEDSVALFPTGRTMFDTIGTKAITHGGISIEEVVVPFVEVLR